MLPVALAGNGSGVEKQAADIQKYSFFASPPRGLFLNLIIMPSPVNEREGGLSVILRKGGRIGHCLEMNPKRHSS